MIPTVTYDTEAIIYVDILSVTIVLGRDWICISRFMNWIISDYQFKKKKKKTQGGEAIVPLCMDSQYFYFLCIFVYFEELGVEIEYFCVTVSNAIFLRFVPLWLLFGAFNMSFDSLHFSIWTNTEEFWNYQYPSV